eukprot:g6010.t1
MTFQLAGLAPSRSYRYRICAAKHVMIYEAGQPLAYEKEDRQEEQEEDDESQHHKGPAGQRGVALDRGSGGFRTAGLSGTDFTLAFSSCAITGSDHVVFRAIQRRDPLFFLHMGDLHYGNIEEDDDARYAAAFDAALGAPSQSALYRRVPTAYMWDDHDFGPNNSDGTSPSRLAALRAYLSLVPSYPLAGTPGTSGGAAPMATPAERQAAAELHGVGHAFTVNGVRFIITDIRSRRTPNDAPDVAAVPLKTTMGQAQLAWLKRELLAADREALATVWCSTMPWHDNMEKWGWFGREQRDLVDFITRHGLAPKLYMVSGDAHMVAADDGSHVPGGFPLFHASALDKKGSVKGGPYTHGVFPGPGQWGELTFRFRRRSGGSSDSSSSIKEVQGDAVDDTRSATSFVVCAEFRGQRVKPGGGLIPEELLRYDECGDVLQRHQAQEKEGEGEAAAAAAAAVVAARVVASRQAARQRSRRLGIPPLYVPAFYGWPIWVRQAFKALRKLPKRLRKRKPPKNKAEAIVFTLVFAVFGVFLWLGARELGMLVFGEGATTVKDE